MICPVNRRKNLQDLWPHIEKLTELKQMSTRQRGQKLTHNAFSIPGVRDPIWSARQSGSTTTSSFKTEKAPTCRHEQCDQMYEL